MIADPVLVVIDMQNDFCNPRFTDLGAQEDHAQSAVEAASRFLRRYRASGRTPILVRTIHDELSAYPTWLEAFESRERGTPCLNGTQGAEFHPELGVEESDIVVTKHQYSGFYGTDLEDYLRSNDTTHLLVCGVNTNICVQSTVFDAFNRGYYVSVLEDCTTTRYEKRFHTTFLENFDSRHFCEVVEADDLELESAAEATVAD